MVNINILISGVSVSGDIDTTTVPVRISQSNSDQVGYATFVLQNTKQTYSRYMLSGNPTFEVQINNVTQIRGTIERMDNVVGPHGSYTFVRGYDYSQELLSSISPDARQQSPTISTGWSLISGDQGMSALDGFDVAAYGIVSGANVVSGPTVALFLSQFYGVSGDTAGTASGRLRSFKPHISGITWRTYYWRDKASDSNANYWIPPNTLKVRRDYAFDVLRRLTRQGLAIDSAGNRVPFESYVDVSGGIHVFTSGHAEPFIASGITLQYYETGKSGATMNNIVTATIPFDATLVKNRIAGWFPTWALFPTNRDDFTDIIAYSGSRWSGIAVAGGTIELSGYTPVSGSLVSQISIHATASGNTNPSQAEIIYTHQSGSFDLSRLNVAGAGVKLVGDYFFNREASTTDVYRNVQIMDTSGNFFIKSGIGGPASNRISGYLNQWTHWEDYIYTPGGTFNSGSGQDGGWALSTTLPDLTRISQMKIAIGTDTGINWRIIATDMLHFQFGYNFSPIIAFNSGSQGLYGRRYGIFEYPYAVSLEQASGIITTELNSRMGSRAVAEFTVKNNPLLPFDAQLGIKPGQTFIVDAPSLNTGSGQTFMFWRAVSVEHEYSVNGGFLTHLQMLPWHSGTLTDPASNLVDYVLAQIPKTEPPRNRLDWLALGKVATFGQFGI